MSRHRQLRLVNLEMLTRQISLSALIFLAVYLVQEAVVNQFRFPGGGFHLFLILALVWAIRSSPEIGAVIGFAAGFLMDISQSTDGPMGHWTLIMVLMGYGLAFLSFENESVRSSPVTVVFFVVAGVFLAKVFYLLTGALLGLDFGEIGQIFLTILGTSLWTLAISPFLLPIFTRLHAFVFDTRIHI